MITDKGEKHNKTKVNFHEPKKEKIKEAVPIKISTKTLPNPSPSLILYILIELVF